MDASPAVAAEIEGYRQAMSYIQRLASAGSDFAYGKESWLVADRARHRLPERVKNIAVARHPPRDPYG